MTPLILVELLVRLGVVVIADGTIKPRWYGSDQAKVCKRVQARWWSGKQAAGMPRGVGFMTPANYYYMRAAVTGSNHQLYKYREALS